MTDLTTTWNGRIVRGYEVPSGDALKLWEFPEDYFPWLCETESGLDFVSTDWRILEDGSWDACQVGVSFDDLIDSFIGIEGTDRDPEGSRKRRADAIATLERAIHTLKTEPLRCMPPRDEVNAKESS